MNEVVTSVLTILGVGSIFIIGAVVGGAIVISGIKNVINFIRGKKD